MLWVLLVGNPDLHLPAGALLHPSGGLDLRRHRFWSEGREKILPGITYVFLSNHQGNFDGPVLGACHTARLERSDQKGNDAPAGPFPCPEAGAICSH